MSKYGNAKLSGLVLQHPCAGRARVSGASLPVATRLYIGQYIHAWGGCWRRQSCDESVTTRGKFHAVKRTGRTRRQEGGGVAPSVLAIHRWEPIRKAPRCRPPHLALVSW